MKKKLIAGIAAILCVFGSVGITSIAKGSSPVTALTASAADTDLAVGGIHAGDYKYAYADTSVYSTKFTKVTLKSDGSDISTWTAENGNTYSIYKVAVSDLVTKEAVLNEYVIGLTSAKETNLDVVIEKVPVPENVMTAFTEKGYELASDEVQLLADSSFAGSYLKSIDMTGVKYIGSKAFNKCAYITDIVIPSSVVYIGDYAFDSSGLKTLSIASELPVIPKYLCSNTKLTKLELAYPQYVHTISEGAFMNTPIDAPLFMSCYGDDVSGYESLFVGKSAYANCTSIKSVVIPANVRILSIGSFKGCTSLTNLVCGENLYGLDQESFMGCTALDTIVFNNVLEGIGGAAFNGCTSLKQVTGIPETVKDWVADPDTPDVGIGFGKGVFAGCTALELCELPRSLTKVPNNTFENCISLTTMKGSFNDNGDNFYSIGANAFKNCTSLTDVVYKNVDTVDANAYTGCTGITKVDLPAAVYIGGTTQAISPKDITINLDENKITGAGGSFSGCTSLKSVNIPASKYILKNTFKGCTGMTEFKAGECKFVGNYALDGCTGLTEITLLSDLYGDEEPKSTNKTDGFVFNNCSGAKKITIKSGYMVKTPNGLFNGCSSLETIDGDLTNIAIVSPKTFAGCSSLKGIDLPAVRILEENAFADCTSIKKISNSSNILNAEDYGDNCFLNCTELNIDINGSISTIGDNAFKNSGILSVNIEGMQGGTVVIGNNAFASCQNLKYGKILSDSAAKFSIGTGIFTDCPILEEAVYDGNIIVASMFKNCPQLKKVSTNATNIKAYAFDGDAALTAVKSLKDTSKSIIADEIAGYAFRGCTALSEFPADSHTNMVGTDNFANCASIKEVDVSVLTSRIFSGCTSLAKANINNIVTIPTGAFQGCTALTGIDLSKVTSIGTNAFTGSGLKSVTIPNAQTVGASAFANCTALETANVTADTIGKSAFAGATALKKAVLDTATIGSSAFNGCTTLSDVQFKDNGTYELAKIDSSAFNACNSLNVLVVKNNPTFGTRSVGFNGTKVKKDFYLVGNTDSTAQAYATKNSVNFININDYDPSKPIVVTTTVAPTTAAAATTKAAPATTTTAAGTVSTKSGDANGDNKVDIADSVKILQFLANGEKYALTESGAKNADCDGENGITGKDALTVQMVDAKLLNASELPLKK